MYKHMNACPMKPNKYKLKTDPRYKIQEKFKGIRAFLFATETSAFIQTRGGFFVEQNFPHFRSIRGNWVLDGELWQLGVEDEKIAGWANCKYLTEDTSGVQFQAFDIVDYYGKNLCEYALGTRDKYREEVVIQLDRSDVVYVPYLEGDPEELFMDIVSRGGEGLMYKNLHSGYAQREGDNRPANHWYKEKGVEDFDVIVIGYKDAKPGKFEGQIGAIHYGMWFENGIIPLGYCSGMSDDVRWNITVNQDKYLMRPFEVRAAGQDVHSGALIEPRFIRWRDDKKPEQCLFIREER